LGQAAQKLFTMTMFEHPTPPSRVTRKINITNDKLLFW